MKKFKPYLPLTITVVIIMAIYLALYLNNSSPRNDEGRFSKPLGQIEAIIGAILSLLALLVVASKQAKDAFKNLRWPEKPKAEDKGAALPKKIVIWTTKRRITPKVLATLLTERPGIAKELEDIPIAYNGRISQMEIVNGNRLRLSIIREGLIFTIEIRVSTQASLNSYRIKDRIGVDGVIMTIDYPHVLIGNAKVTNLSVRQDS